MFMVVNLPANKNAPPADMAANLSKNKHTRIQLPLHRRSRHCACVSIGHGEYPKIFNKSFNAWPLKDMVDRLNLNDQKIKSYEKPGYPSVLCERRISRYLACKLKQKMPS